MAQFLSLILLACVPLSIYGQGPLNLSPTVRIIEPATNVTVYSLSNSVIVRAEASDPDGTIAEVKLFENGMLIASDFQAPYEFIFKPFVSGRYTVEVEAVDNAGATAFTTRVIEYIRVNDDFGPMAGLSGTNLTLRANTMEATRQKGEPNHAGGAGGRSVWWTWRPTVTGTVTIDTFGSDFDTVLGVYTNMPATQAPSALTNLLMVAENDDDEANPPLSRVKFFAFALRTYYIAVDGRDGFAGNVVLNIRQTAARAAGNDFIAGAVRVFGTTVQLGSNVGATKEPGEPEHAGSAGGASMWWRYEGGQGPVSISTTGSTFDTVLAVYTNVSILNRDAVAMENLRLVVANDDSGTSTSRTSVVEFTARFGTTYWVAVDGYNGQEGNIRISFNPPQQRTVPRNDLFFNAATLRGSSIITNANTFLATSERDEPEPIAPKAGAKSVWYRWVAPESGLVYLTTKGSDFDTLLSVFVGTNIANLALVGSNDDDGGLSTSALTFVASGGTEYRIAVAGFQGAGGDMVLTLNQPSSRAPRLITQFAQGRLSISASKVEGTFVLETSPDLVTWSFLREMTAEEVVVGGVPQEGHRQQFYRLRNLP